MWHQPVFRSVRPHFPPRLDTVVGVATPGKLVIATDCPEAPDVRALLNAHLAFANEHSPPEDVHALDVTGLLAPNVSFFSARSDGTLLGVGALKRLDAEHAEIKSMHTAAASRGTGVGRAMVKHLLATARDSGLRRVSLETGSMDAFIPARSLYRSFGFQYCEPFAEYFPSRNSVCMTLLL
jgi:putative acetyltransferase